MGNESSRRPPSPTAEWYELKGFSCPAKGCPDRSGSYDWVCARCDTSMFIAQTGYLKCRYGTHNSRLNNWLFNCGKHDDHPANEDGYLGADRQGFTFALSHAVQLMDKAGALWVGALCAEIDKQY